MGMEPKCFRELKSNYYSPANIRNRNEVSRKASELLKTKKKSNGNKKQVQLEVVGKPRRKGR